MHKKLTIVQTTVASYRMPLFNTIRKVLQKNFLVYCGDRFFEPTIRLDDDFKPDQLLENKFILSNKVLWQSGLLKNALQEGILILSLNPRVVSNWVVLLVRKICNKPVFLWGHAWPKGGKDTKSEKLRHIMRSLADEIIVYTYNQKKELQEKMPAKKIHVAPNALYFNKQMVHSYIANPSDIIYVGRMVENKKVELLYRAFKDAMTQLPNATRLILIGDGPERNKIVEYIKQDKLEDRVVIPGSITAIEELHNYYKSSLISVSPGRVGLSLTQSLGFGVPMIIARNELHGPEIEAAVDNKAYFFKENDVQDLSHLILNCFKNKIEILRDREEVSEFCKSNYSIEAMANTFINLIEN